MSFKQFDWILATSAVLLIALGTLMILSTILEPGVAPLKNELFLDHLLNVALGLAAFFAVSQFDYRHLHFLAIPFYVFNLALLAIVPILGLTTQGATRWLSIGAFTFQPSELSKVFLTVSLASFFVAFQKYFRSFRLIVGSVGLVAIPIALVYIQPDLGTALTLCAVWIGMLFLSGIRRRYILMFLLLFVVALPLSWKILAPYQKERIEVFLNPQHDPLGSGYTVLQSVIAVGSGQIFGRGWGRGTQSHLQFLPARSTDFIFATLSEELGFMGVFLLLLLFFILLWRLLVISQRANSLFATFLSIGFFSLLLFQIVINIGMNIGLMPITGIPLPLVSYGGSSLISTMIALGICESIAQRRT